MTYRVIQGYFRTGLAIPVGQSAQMKSAGQKRPGVNAFPVVLRAAIGGMPLPIEVQTKMESALGANFSDVRIHIGPEAASVGAIAFTWGSNIHFAPGHYNPGTPQGQELLGHELAHVRQQRAGRVTNPFGRGVAVVQDVALEAEADRLGRQAARSVAAVAPQAAGGAAAVKSGVVSRKVDPVANYQRDLTSMPNRLVFPSCDVPRYGDQSAVRIFRIRTEHVS
jgi:hypothetical protein